MKAYAVVAGGNSLVGTHDRRNAAIEDARNTARQLNEYVEIKRLNVFGDAYESVVLIAPAGGGRVEAPARCSICHDTGGHTLACPTRWYR